MPTNNNINYGPAPIPGTTATPVLGNNIDRAPVPVSDDPAISRALATPVLGNNIDRAPAAVTPSVAIGINPLIAPVVIPVEEQPVDLPPGNTTAAVTPIIEQAVDTTSNIGVDTVTVANQQRYITVLANGAVVITNATSLNFAGSGVSVSASGTTGANITISGGGGNANLGNLAIDNYNIYNTNGQGVVISNFSFIDEAETAYVQIPAGNSTANLNIVQTQGNVRIAANAAAWLFDDTGNLTLPDGTSFQNFGPSSSEWHAGANGYVSLASNNGNTYMWVDNNGAYIATNWIPGAYQWTFDANGQTIPPALSVARGDNPSGNISGYTLNLGNGSQEAIITTPDGDADGNPDSQRIVINPGKGADTTSGEGGDIYLWAGRGGNAGGTGGDVKIRGGQGMVDGGGGYIRIEGGDSQGAGAGGYIDLIGGTSTTNTGGPIQIQSGQGVAGANIDLTGGTGTDGPGGNINITGGVSANGLAEYGNIFINAGASTWTFDNTGTLNLPGGTGTVESSANNISIYSDAGQINGMLMYDTGAEIYALQDFAIFTDNANASHIWRFYANGSMTAPGAINVGDMSIGTVPGDITADANTGVTFNVSGPDGGFAVNYLDEVGNANTSGGELAFSSETGNATYRISLSDDLGDGFATKIWRFDGTGNLTLPTNSFNVNYANGTQVSLGGGGNTGNVTFNDQVVQGTGDETGGGGLYLAPGTNSTANLQYLRVRGGDYPTHIHLDTGNNNYFDQYFGADFRYVKLEANGNILINADDDNGNSATWTFDTDGKITLPYGAVVRDTAGNAVAFGLGAGLTNQNNYAVAIGTGAGLDTQGVAAVAIGSDAGQTSQGIQAIAIGTVAGANAQGTCAVAIGSGAGQQSQGQFAVALGYGAGDTNQGNNSIIINATSATLDQTTANTFTVAPIRNDVANVAEILFYNTASKEITYGNTISVAGNITAGNFIGGGSNVELVAGSYTATFDNTGNLTVPTNVNTSGLLVDTVTGITANAGNIDINQVTGMGGYLNATGVSITGNITGNTAGFAIGYRDIPQVSFSANATAALADAGKHYYSTTAGNLALTLPDNSNVALPTGATLTVVVNAAGNVLVNQGTGVSLYMVGSSATGNRVVGAYGLASVMKVAANTWVISGTGVY